MRPESGRPLTVLWASVGAEKAMSSSQEARACSFEWPRAGWLTVSRRTTIYGRHERDQTSFAVILLVASSSSISNERHNQEQPEP